MTKKKATTEKAAPKALSLFEIDDRLEEILLTHMDPSTGEIGEEAVAELEELEIKREDKLFGYVYIIKQYEGMVETADKEVARLKGRAKAFQNHIAWLRNRILEAVPAGTELQHGPRRIWYRRVTTVAWKDDVKTEDIPHVYCKHKKEEWTPQTGLVRDDLKANKPEAVAVAEVKRGWSLNYD